MFGLGVCLLQDTLAKPIGRSARKLAGSPERDLAGRVDEVSPQAAAMQVSLHDAKTPLYAAQALGGRGGGDRQGKPAVGALVPVEQHPARRRAGFLLGKSVITADLKADFSADIKAMFG